MNKPTDGAETTQRADGATAQLPEQVTDLIRDYPGLAVAAGLGLGLLAGALLPRSPARKLLSGGALLAASLGDVGYELGKQAIAKASEAASEGRERLGDLGEQIGEQASGAGQRAAGAARTAADAGQAAAESAQKLAVDATSLLRELGQDLAKQASKTLARLRD